MKKVLAELSLSFQTKCRIQIKSITSQRKLSWHESVCQFYVSAFGKVDSPPNESWKKQGAVCAVFINHGDKPSENGDAAKLVILLLYPLANYVHPNSTESVSNGGPPECLVPSFTDSFGIRANIFLLQLNWEYFFLPVNISLVWPFNLVSSVTICSTVLYCSVYNSYTVSEVCQD